MKRETSWCALLMSALFTACMAPVDDAGATTDAAYDDEVGATASALVPQEARCEDSNPAFEGRTRRVALRSLSSRLFARAVGGGGSTVTFDSNGIDEHETFSLVELDDGQVGLLSYDCQLVSAIGGGGGAVLADKSVFGSWETFTMTRFGGYARFETYDGHYLTSGTPMRAAATTSHYLWLVDLDGTEISLATRPDASRMAVRAAGEDHVHTDYDGVAMDHTAMIDLGFGEVALRFHDRYLRAERGGGYRVRADAAHIRSHERFLIAGSPGGSYTFQTASGHYLAHDRVRLTHGLLSWFFGEVVPAHWPSHDGSWVISADERDRDDADVQWRIVELEDADSVTLRSRGAERYLSAPSGNEVYSSSSASGGDEMFSLVEIGVDGSGRRIVALRSSPSWWVSASGVEVTQARYFARPREHFVVVDGPDGDIALRTRDGRYVTIRDDGSVDATATSVGSDQLFQVCTGGPCRPSVPTFPVFRTFR